MHLKVRTVAIVEDDDLVRSATVSLIRSLGIRALPFGSALDFLAAEPADLGCIVSDVHMPGMSGLELLETLRARGNAVPVILMTAYPTEPMRTRAMAAGAHCFLEKPCAPDDLVACLAEILGPLDD